MCNKGMRARHWSKMSELMGFDITPNAGTTLRKVLKLDIAPHMEMFEGISAAATKVRSWIYCWKYPFIPPDTSYRLSNSYMFCMFFLLIGTLLGESNGEDDGWLGQHQLQFNCLQRFWHQYPVFSGWHPDHTGWSNRQDTDHERLPFHQTLWSRNQGEMGSYFNDIIIQIVS